MRDDFLDSRSGRGVTFGWNARYYADIRMLCHLRRNNTIAEWCGGLVEQRMRAWIIHGRDSGVRSLGEKGLSLLAQKPQLRCIAASSKGPGVGRDSVKWVLRFMPR